jgi:uncharacterized protein (TIGR02996 family)
MSALTALLAHLRANPSDDASWLVIADRLIEGNNPLGEYIVLTLKYQDRATPESKKRRLRKLARDWQATWAPWAKFRDGGLYALEDERAVHLGLS